MAKSEYLTSPPKISGWPPGVPYIIGNEAAERFSYYGMNSIIVIFWTTYLVVLRAVAYAKRPEADAPEQDRAPSEPQGSKARGRQAGSGAR